MSKVHKENYRVYYEDTDAMGIMYHANYIVYCERGRTEMLRDVGLSASSLNEELGINFVIRHINANYLKMVQLDDLLTVETTVQTMKNTSFVMKQSIHDQDDAVFSMDITIVCVDLSGKPVKIPAKLREKFLVYKTEE